MLRAPVTDAANGQSGVGSFLHAVVTATGTSLARDDMDMTLTFSETFNIGARGLTIPIGGYIDAQVDPAVISTSSTMDLLDLAAVAFTVPAGIQFTSDGFLEAGTSPVPEPATPLMLGAALAAAGLVRKRCL